MRFSEMTPQQRQEELSFVETLSAAGWEAHPIAKMLRADMSVSPEGHALLSTEKADLGLQLFLEERALVLLIQSRQADKSVRLRFEHWENLEAFLSWLKAQQGDLAVEAFAEPLREALPMFKGVFLVDDAGTRYQIGLKA